MKNIRLCRVSKKRSTNKFKFNPLRCSSVSWVRADPSWEDLRHAEDSCKAKEETENDAILNKRIKSFPE